MNILYLLFILLTGSCHEPFLILHYKLNLIINTD